MLSCRFFCVLICLLVLRRSCQTKAPASWLIIHKRKAERAKAVAAVKMDSIQKHARRAGLHKQQGRGGS